MADLVVTGGGTVYLLDPVSDVGKDWCAEHLPEDATRWGTAYAVEHRYIGPIIEGAQNDGLVVA